MRPATCPRTARGRGASLTILILGVAALSSRSEPAATVRAPPDWKVAFAGPISGPLAASGQESLIGVKVALAIVADEAGIEMPELIELDDGDDPKRAEAAFAAAKKQKADVLVAAATAVTAEIYVEKARKEKLPLLLVGNAGPLAPALGGSEPVLWLGATAVERAITIGTFLEIPCKSRKPAFVVEETPHGRELAAALERNLGARFELAGTLHVAPHAELSSDALAPLRDAGADRIVVCGEPDLLDATVKALAQADWDAPLFVDDGMNSAAAATLRDERFSDRFEKAFLLQGFPRFVDQGSYTMREIAKAATAAGLWPAPDDESASLDAVAGAGPVPMVPRPAAPDRAIRSFTAVRLFFRAAAGSRRKPKLAELIELLRDQSYGPEENERPLLDETNRSARNRWLPWKRGEDGPVPDVETYYFDPDMGPLLRVRPPSLYRAEPGTKVVWFTYGDAYSKAARSIESDLAALGLITRGYDGEMDRWILDELMARTLGKINKLFLKHEDGTFIPGVSFAISFTTEKPESLKEREYWRAVIAGDDSAAGGRAWPGEGRCEIYSTFMMRTMFKQHALDPPLKGEDRRFLDGKYAWGSTSAENLRVKLIRALIDGYAGSFALTGAHELGHIAGLGHDESDPRSIMNVTEGAGLFETSACWIPEHVEVLERALGRFQPPKARKK